MMSIKEVIQDLVSSISLMQSSSLWKTHISEPISVVCNAHAKQISASRMRQDGKQTTKQMTMKKYCFSVPRGNLVQKGSLVV
jgi:hypothetical protein